MGRYLDFAKIRYLDDRIIIYGKEVYDIECGDKPPFENVASVVHAHWIPVSPKIGYYRCSNCGTNESLFDFGLTVTERNIFDDWSYCRRCGAKMDGDKNANSV